MYFTETPSLREIEKAMKMVPNFTPRGHGVVILCKHEFAEKSCIGDSQKEILARTVSRINNPLFQKRFQKYINESETIPVNFRNSKHSTTFTDAIKKKNKRDYALMSALYLLTAEFALWQTVKRYIVDNSIDFKSLQPAGISENGYTLFCAAKDLYLGTNYLTISDLADTQLIPPRMFALICNAMAIRRFGLNCSQRTNCSRDIQQYPETRRSDRNKNIRGRTDRRSEIPLVRHIFVGTSGRRIRGDRQFRHSAF